MSNIIFFLIVIVLCNKYSKSADIDNIIKYDKICLTCKKNNYDSDVINNNCKLEAISSFKLLNKINRFDNETDFYNLNWALSGLIRSKSWNYYSSKIFSIKIIKYLKNIVCNEKRILYYSENFFKTLSYTNELVLRSYNDTNFKNIFLHLSEFNNGFYIWNPTLKNYMYILQFYSNIKKISNKLYQDIIDQSVNQFMNIGKNVFFKKNLNDIHNIIYKHTKIIFLKNIINNSNLKVYTYNNDINYDFYNIIDVMNTYANTLNLPNNLHINVYILNNKENFDLYLRQEIPNKYYYEDDYFYELDNKTITLYSYNSILFPVFFKELYTKAILYSYYLQYKHCSIINMPTCVKYGYKDYCNVNILKSLITTPIYDFKEKILNNPTYSSVILNYLLHCDNKYLIDIFNNFNNCVNINPYNLIKYSKFLLKNCNKNYNFFSTNILDNSNNCKLVTFKTLYYDIILSNNKMYIKYHNESINNIINKIEYNNFISLYTTYIINHLSNNDNYFPKKNNDDNYIQYILCDNRHIDIIKDEYLLSIYNILNDNNGILKIQKCYVKPVIINKQINTNLKNLISNINGNFNSKTLIPYKSTIITDLSCKIKTVNDYVKIYTNTCSNSNIKDLYNFDDKYTENDDHTDDKYTENDDHTDDKYTENDDHTDDDKYTENDDHTDDKYTENDDHTDDDKYTENDDHTDDDKYTENDDHTDDDKYTENDDHINNEHIEDDNKRESNKYIKKNTNNCSLYYNMYKMCLENNI